MAKSSPAAAAAGVGRRRLERHFAENVGRPIASYLRELRLIRARQLVTETGLRLGDVATACGFSNAQHFSNAFRKAYGRTPTSARQRV